MNGSNEAPSVDWFNITTDPETDPAKKCVYCKDQKRNPFEDPDSEANSYATTDCRHLVCGLCQKTHPAGQVKCPLCGSRIQTYSKVLPEYLALKALNEVKKEIYKEWNLTREDFPNQQEYDSFLERREDVIAKSLCARTLSGEDRNKLLFEIKAIRDDFRQRYKDAIHRNDSRVSERWVQIESEIKTEELIRKELRRRMEREVLEEEENRRRLELQKNNERLGTTRLQENFDSRPKERERVQDQRTYLFSRTDLNIYGPPPVPVPKSSKTAAQQEKPIPSQETIFRAGGLLHDVVHQRSLCEMRAGWSLLC